MRSLSGQQVDVRACASKKCEDPMLSCPSSWDEYRDVAWEKAPPCKPQKPKDYHLDYNQDDRIKVAAEMMERHDMGARGSLEILIQNHTTASGLKVEALEAKQDGVSVKMRALIYGPPEVAKSWIQRQRQKGG